MEVFQTDLKTLLEDLKKEGLGITKRTLQYYQQLGLLPGPIKTVGERGRGVYGFYYTPDIVKTLKYINKCKSDGLTLEQIKDEMEKDIREKCIHILFLHGFRDYNLSGLFEDSLIGEYEENLARASMKICGLPEKYLREIRSMYLANTKRIEDSIVSKIKWWYWPEMVEGTVLQEIDKLIEGILRGSFFFLARNPRNLSLIKQFRFITIKQFEIKSRLAELSKDFSKAKEFKEMAEVLKKN